MTTLEIPTPPDVCYIHVITTTHKDAINTPSPASKVTRRSYRRTKDGSFEEYHAIEHDHAEIYKGIKP